MSAEFGDDGRTECLIAGDLRGNGGGRNAKLTQRGEGIVGNVRRRRGGPGVQKEQTGLVEQSQGEKTVVDIDIKTMCDTHRSLPCKPREPGRERSIKMCLWQRLLHAVTERGVGAKKKHGVEGRNRVIENTTATPFTEALMVQRLCIFLLKVGKRNGRDSTAEPHFHAIFCQRKEKIVTKCFTQTNKKGTAWNHRPRLDSETARGFRRRNKGCDFCVGNAKMGMDGHEVKGKEMRQSLVWGLLVAPKEEFSESGGEQNAETVGKEVKEVTTAPCGTIFLY